MKAAMITTSDITTWSERLSDDMTYAATHFGNEMELREHVHKLIADAIDDLYSLGLSATAGEFNTKKTGTRSPLDRLYGGVAVEWEWDMKNARREHGARQALDYLANIREHHPSNDAYTAVVCDGKQWGFLKHDPEEHPDDLFSTPAPARATDHFMWVENSPAACRQFLELIGAHKKSPITSKNLTTRFGPSSAVAGRLVTVLSQSMAGRLPHDRTDTLHVEWRRALDVIYGDLDKNDNDLALEVQRVYRTPVARPLGELLFVLHTYFALVGRVIAVELLAVAAGELDEAPSSWRGMTNEELLHKLRDLELGRLPGDLDITNLFEADLFSWWADRAESNNDLLDAIRDLLKELSELAFPKIAFGPQRGGDVLRDLYQALIPNKLRKALGEFLTPHWLAEACLSRLREQGADLAAGRVLDPTCGTGTFIVPVLTDRLRRLSRQMGDRISANDVQDVLNSVTGIDLNPVAVTATRVNYVIALGDLANLGALTLPVWRADSLVVPEASPKEQQTGAIAGIGHSSLVTSLDEPFAVPRSMTTGQQIATLRSLIERAVLRAGDTDPTADQVDRSRKTFLTSFEEEFGADGRHPLVGVDFQDESRVAAYLFDQITKLSLARRDGVWARLIENAYAPLFAGTFDVIVGNPPWLTWTKLPQAWRDQSETLWRRFGLWYTPDEHGESFSLQSADIATLVFAVSLARYAKDGAFVGLLTPAALINADPGGRAFRQFRLRPDKRDKERFDSTEVRFRGVWVDDWSKMTPFAPDAANKPIFLIVKRGETQGTDTPGAVWSRSSRRGIDRMSWRRTQPMLLASLGSFAPVDPNIATSAWRFQDVSRPNLIIGGTNSYTFGKGLDTRGANGLYFVKVSRTQPAAGGQRATVQIENLPAEGRNKKVAAMKGRVESDLVYPLLRGKDVRHWVARPVTYMVLPHDPAELDRPLTAATFRREYPLTLAWLSRQRPLLAIRKAPPTRSWNMSATGDDWCRVDGALQHMQTGHVVVVRELSSRPAAALVETRTDYELGGRTVAPLIDHKLMLCSVPSRDEALYLIAMINSTPMQDLLESFVNSIAVSPKSMKRLPIPDFDSDDPEMQELVSFADQIVTASDPEAKATGVQGLTDAHVLKIIAARADYEPQPKPTKRTTRRTAPPQENAGLF